MLSQERKAVILEKFAAEMEKEAIFGFLRKAKSAPLLAEQLKKSKNLGAKLKAKAPQIETNIRRSKIDEAAKRSAKAQKLHEAMFGAGSYTR